MSLYIVMTYHKSLNQYAFHGVYDSLELAAVPAEKLIIEKDTKVHIESIQLNADVSFSSLTSFFNSKLTNHEL
ncbi:MAG: hypothetical protein ABJH98_17870 [Reichenbachiella sp.]|uniref:hypothetical protein n=1 Tax=Reichenbachiella sp. TaxID=2184521 RepID=UPI003267B480